MASQDHNFVFSAISNNFVFSAISIQMHTNALVECCSSARHRTLKCGQAQPLAIVQRERPKGIER
jgi:hypothetical protein